ncbi:galanin-like G-protein coupled receptor npr-9 [Physella acuta]|uniref:galanin-like G-protein coupled receptor npr-9 n=1 Tax=Physella acuta TaxID=109671 RepID=UPI0027DC42E2|nr:galanin-like G-protein coupled receptor npr-9 [Physella acuta]
MSEIIDLLLATPSSMQDNVTTLSTVLCLFRGVVSLVGVVGNSLTIRTFIAMGLKDGVTLSFLFLSVCDLLFLVLEGASSISCVFVCVERVSNYTTYFPVDPYSVDFYLLLCASEFYHCAMVTIIFLAIVRCLSVASPLWFRNKLGTKLVSIVASSVIAISVFAIEIPIFAFMGIIPQFDKNTNTTRALFWASPKWHIVTDVIWTVMGLILTNCVQIILLISAIAMKIVLTKALSFRKKCTLAHNDTNTSYSDVTHTESKLQLTSKEIRITQQLFVLSLTYIISNTPRACFHPPQLLFPELSIFGKHGRLFEVIDVIVHTCQCVFCCGNVLIYLRFNSRFRQLFWRNFNNKQA